MVGSFVLSQFLPDSVAGYDPGEAGPDTWHARGMRLGRLMRNHAALGSQSLGQDASLLDNREPRGGIAAQCGKSF